jgi:hypothetical protein
MMKSFNTGPKGVQEDRRNFEEAKRAQQAVLLKRQASQTLASTPMVSLEELPTFRSAEDEGNWMEDWREERMKEMSKGERARLYGTLLPTDSSQFIAHLETEPKVIVLVDEFTAAGSREIKTAVEALAQKFSNILFLQLPWHETDFDEDMIPCILEYSNGNLVSDVVCLVEEFPPNQTIEHRGLLDILKR